MRLDDLVRRLDQEPGRPERVGQVVAASLELGGETAVEHDDGPAGQERGEGSGEPVGGMWVVHPPILRRRRGYRRLPRGERGGSIAAPEPATAPTVSRRSGDGQASQPAATAAGDIDAAALKRELGEKVAALVVQTPNYFGVLERGWELERDVHAAGALVVASVDPVSLSLLRPPGEWGADIAVGECQPLGNEMSFGGPLVGFMACRQEFIRQMPGRIVSATRDVDGRDAFVLVLQTREQHIRREKATSNICTNQGLLATRTCIYLSLLGEHGFAELGRVCHARARKLADMIAACDGYALAYPGPFFREFVVACPTDADAVVVAARKENVLAGIPLARYFGPAARQHLLVAVTEKHQDEDFDKLCAVLKRAAMVKVG